MPSLKKSTEKRLNFSQIFQIQPTVGGGGHLLNYSRIICTLSKNVKVTMKGKGSNK